MDIARVDNFYTRNIPTNRKALRFRRGGGKKNIFLVTKKTKIIYCYAPIFQYFEVNNL